MEYKTFHGLEDVYPEKLDGTSEWFYGQVTPCSEAYEVSEYQGSYIGTRLYIFHISGKVYVPFQQEKNVFLAPPIYSAERNSFGILRYDFNKGRIQAYEYIPETEELSIFKEIKMPKTDELRYIRVIKEPFMLVKCNWNENSVDFLEEKENHVQLEENESLCYVERDVLITQKWIEDPDYREEIIYRHADSGKVIKREDGYIVEMPDGKLWIMTR